MIAIGGVQSLAKMPNYVEKTSSHPRLRPTSKTESVVRTFAVRHTADSRDRAACSRLASTDLCQRRRDVGAHGAGRLGGAAQPCGLGSCSVEHGIEMTGKVFVQTLYLATAVSKALPGKCCAVNVSPLLRELIRHASRAGNAGQNRPGAGTPYWITLDQLSALPTIPLQLPWPSDERAQRAAAWLRAHPEDPGLIKQMAKRVVTSARTLERLFQQQTGMTFGRWRQQLRLLQALRFLAEGRSVTAVSHDVGYDSPSAFIAMFKRTLGTTPHRYFA